MVDAERLERGRPTMIFVLAVGWGIVAATPILRWSARARVSGRGLALAAPVERVAAWNRWHRRAAAAPPVALVLRVVRGARIARRKRADSQRLVAELPVAVDLVSVAIGSGCTPLQAVEVAAVWGPPRVAAELAEIVHACALGVSFNEALRERGRAASGMRPLTDALLASARLGAPIAPALARLARELRSDLRRSLESKARTVPVRLLFPLVFCILPAFALLTVVPALVGGFSAR